MPGINRRKKGARGEKLACKVFSEWVKCPFHRVPASGGLHWRTANTCGDIVAGDDLVRFNFSVEVKNYADLNFGHLLMPHVDCDILKFWKQCKTDAVRGKKIPLLMMRYDGMKRDLFFVVMKEVHFNQFEP